MEKMASRNYRCGENSSHLSVPKGNEIKFNSYACQLCQILLGLHSRDFGMHDYSDTILVHWLRVKGRQTTCKQSVCRDNGAI